MIVDEVPPGVGGALPDLRTRLAVTPIARIAEPDDALFRGDAPLLFADRGLHIADEALRFITERVERSYFKAERVVEAIDRFAIAERARLTLPTIRRALAEGGLIDLARRGMNVHADGARRRELFFNRELRGWRSIAACWRKPPTRRIRLLERLALPVDFGNQPRRILHDPRRRAQGPAAAGRSRI